MEATSFPKDKIKILLLEGIHKNAVETFKKFGYENVTLLKTALPEEELIEALKGVHMVGLRSKTQMTAKVIKSAEKLMAIGCFCIGTNQVDLETAEKLGIPVFNSPHSNTRSVAELVIAECVMLMRRIPERNSSAHRGEWLKDAKNSYELRGKTLGIIGYGNIGSQVSILAESFGMKVIFYDTALKLPLGNAANADFNNLLENSDVVTLHVPAEESTKNLMDKAAIQKIKKGGILINLSRGNVVDIDALKEALENGNLRGAAIDVFPLEPKSKEERFTSPLQGLENVILTPHIGGSTQEAQENIGIDAASKLTFFMDQGKTVGCKTIPELNLPKPKNRKTHRLLHIHQNKPGILSKINTILSDMNVNILGQFLSTNPTIGYVVLDISADVSDEVLVKMKEVDGTINARLLY